MRYLDIIEAKDWKSISDDADQWLAKYTYENLDKWPGKHIIKTLQERYPAKPGKIYRGMNFYSKEEYERFISQFDGSDSASVSFGGVTSWTRDDLAAEQFAITQPTYFLNKEVMIAHGRMQDERERLAGYRGLVLGMHLPENVGIDVDASGLGHESEVILPPGEHRVTVHRIIKKYADTLRDDDTTVDQVILSTTKDDLRSEGNRSSFLKHVLHHHLERLSGNARKHLFSLYLPNPSEPSFSYRISPSRTPFDGEDTDTVDVYYRIPAIGLFDLYRKGAFTDKGQMRDIRELASKVIKSALPVIRKNIIRSKKFDLTPLAMAADVAGKKHELDALLRDTIGAEYRRLEAIGREINGIKDPKKRIDAVKKHTKDLKDLLSKVPGGF